MNKDELISWLHEQRDGLRQAITQVKGTEQTDKDVKNVMKGQLDAYANTIAFVMSDGKLR